MRIYKAKTTLKWFKMLPKPTTRCWRMVLEMQTMCKPKPWQQLLPQLKTLLAFCFHLHSLATTFFTGPIISIQIIKLSSIVSWKGTYIKRRQYWVQTEVKIKLVSSAFFQLNHRALKGRYISSNAFKVPITEKILFCYLKLYLIKITSAKKFCDLKKSRFFYNFLKTTLSRYTRAGDHSKQQARL